MLQNIDPVWTMMIVFAIFLIKSFERRMLHLTSNDRVLTVAISLHNWRSLANNNICMLWSFHFLHKNRHDRYRQLYNGASANERTF